MKDAADNRTIDAFSAGAPENVRLPASFRAVLESTHAADAAPDLSGKRM